MHQSQELTKCLVLAKYFSKLDLKTGFHQTRIAPCVIEKTAFKTKFGHLEFLVVLIGLRSAPTTFQSFMNTFFETT